jgi:hypothetical protein
LANALGLPIDTNDQFTNSINMTMDAMKLYLKVINMYSQYMYDSFDNHPEWGGINNKSVIDNWFQYKLIGNNTPAINIAKRWLTYFTNSASNWAYDPSATGQDEHYYWAKFNGSTPITKESWVLHLSRLILSSLNDKSDNNGDIANQIYYYDAKPYYTTNGIMIFWTCFALFLFTISVVIYTRTDIK